MTVGLYSEQTAKEMLQLFRQIKASGILSKSGRASATITPGYHYVVNESGEEIPAYACMQMTGTSESSGQNYIQVDKPADTDGSAGGFIFNGPAAIEIGGNGIGLAGPVVRALGDGSIATAGDTWGPTVSAWTISPGGGLFRCVGDDDVLSDVLKVQLKTGGITFYRFTLTDVWGAGSGLSNSDCFADITEMDGTAVESGAIVKDPNRHVSQPPDSSGGVQSELKVGDTGLCVLQGGKYWVTTPDGPLLLHVLTPTLNDVPASVKSGMGSANCEIYDVDSSGSFTATGDLVEVYNPAEVAIPKDTLAVASRNRAGLYVFVAWAP